MKKLLPIILLLSASVFAARDTNTKSITFKEFKLNPEREILVLTHMLDAKSITEIPELNHAIIDTPMFVVEGGNIGGYNTFLIFVKSNSKYQNTLCRVYGYNSAKKVREVNTIISPYVSYINETGKIEFESTTFSFDSPKLLECYMYEVEG